MRLLIFVVIFSILSIQTIGQGQPMHTESPFTSGLEGRGTSVVGGFETTNHQDHYYTQLKIPYSISKRIQLKGGLPYHVYNMKNWTGSQSNEYSGIYNYTFDAKFLVFQKQSENKKFGLSVSYKHYNRNINLFNELLPSVFLAGGNPNYQFGVVAGFKAKRIGFYSDVSYFTTLQVLNNISQQIKYAQAFSVILLSRNSKYLSAILEFRGRFNQHRNFHLISPGLQLILSEKVLLEVSYNKSLSQNQTPKSFRYIYGFFFGTKFLIQ